MSQEKVDRYKKEKANRKQSLAKKKQQKVLKTVGGIAASIALIVAIIFSAKLLRGDFEGETERETSSYSEEYLQQIRDLFSTENSTTGSGETDTTSAANK